MKTPNLSVWHTRGPAHRAETTGVSLCEGSFGRNFDCAPTVQESNVFIPFGLRLSEKQIPRFVGNVSS